LPETGNTSSKTVTPHLCDSCSCRAVYISELQPARKVRTTTDNNKALKKYKKSTPSFTSPSHRLFFKHASRQSIPTRSCLPQAPSTSHHKLFVRINAIDIDVASQPPIHNHVINHIAISVPDLDAAVEWYATIFGFKKIRSNRVTDRTLTSDAPIFRIYGDTLQKVKIAFLGTGNSVGFEIFQFIDPAHQACTTEEFEYMRGGVFHICVTTPDVEDAIRRVKEKEGRQIGETVDLGEDLHGEMRKAAYVKDPWGTVVEVLSCGFEALMANRE
jgi:catechol 2,3-dioxygenase-like lactoylglutathione lyase family enzyme